MTDHASRWHRDLSRRSLLRLGAASAAAVAVAACSGESGRKIPVPLPSTAAPSGGPAQPVTTVTTAAPHIQKSGLPLDHTPYWQQTTIGEPQAIVDARASIFLITADERDAQLFLMGWIPNVDVDQVLLGEPIDTPTVLGGAWASGYWHGAYLESLAVATKPRKRVAGTEVREVDEIEFGRLADLAHVDAVRRRAGGEALLDSVDAALWKLSVEAPQRDDEFFGLVEKFGAAYGAFRALVENPPTDAEPLDEYDITCDTGLSCEFAADRLNTSSQLNTRFALRLQNDTGLVGVRRRVDQVIGEATAKGRANWESMMNTHALDAADYRRLVDLYSSRLEARWSVTVAALEAIVQRDSALARRASLGTELLDLWDTASTFGRARAEKYRAPDFVST